MSNLRITDNHASIDLNCESGNGYWHDEIDDNTRVDLQLLANNRIKNIEVVDQQSLLVFPRDLGIYGDDIGEGQIIGMQGDSISTGNIMGFVGVNNTQLDIISRFAKNDKEDYFLHYMLQKVFSVNLFDIKHTTSHQPIFDFLLYLFPYFLKKALRQGIYKRYQRFEHNDANVRGPIDINKHIQRNIPFQGAIAYSTREHSYDNEVTELIRHTIEYIKNHPTGYGVLNCDQETKDAVMTVIQATPSYNTRNCDKIINQNLRQVNHPYYSEYTILQKICIQILRHEAIKYGQNNNKIFGILFDGAWLWEEYLNIVFSKANLDIIHAKNKTDENGVSIFKNEQKKYYPDFYRKTEHPKESFVLDAKYKRLGSDIIVNEKNNKTNTISIDRDDLNQMVSYLHILSAHRCALLYPIEGDCYSSGIVKSKEKVIEGYGGIIQGIGIPISKSETYHDFCNQQDINEKELTDEIKKWIGNYRIN